MEEKKHRKERVGVVVGTACDKTAVVLVSRKIKHPMYKKFVKRTKKMHAHDPKNACKMGDQVAIVECRKISKKKCWYVKNIIQSAQQS